MMVEAHSSETTSRLRLRVTAEADPGALMRVLERFQILNLLPRCVTAESGTHLLHIQIDICGLAETRLAHIAAKIGQVPCVINTQWFRL